MSLKEDLKKVIGPCKEDIEHLKWWKKQPPTTLEQANAQLRASAEFERKRRQESELRRPSENQRNT